MLVIRTEQIVALEQAHVDRFTDEFVNHLRSFAPDRYASLGRDAVRKTVNLGLSNAERHGFTLRGPVRFYLELMFRFGSFFDTDRQYQEVTRPLFDDSGTDEIIRADRLYDRVMNYVDAAAGIDFRFERRALETTANMSYEALASLAGQPSAALVEWISHIYPEKVQALGKPVIRALVNDAGGFAISFGPSCVGATPLFALLMFILGSNCFSDPQFPWLVRALDRPAMPDAEVALEEAFRGFITLLAPFRSTLEKR